MFNSVTLENVTVLGELGHRLLRNCMRLESDIYQPDKVYQPIEYDWPADWEGRVLLALVRQMEATHREPSYMREIFRGVYARFNEKGYLGKILPEGFFDEQQISGHNWLLRALLEYTRLTGDTEARAAALRIIENLYLPLKGAYHRYPIRPEYRVFEGNPDGSLTGDCIEGWYLSTDIGCAYMCLDALGMACRDLKLPELPELLEEMVGEFAAIDFWNLSMQTHATLSGIRGILWYYEAVHRPELLDTAVRLYTMYLDKGTTENYANHNWFNRPLWTEPCAIVDSHIVAMELFRLTEEVKWLETAQRIYYNALCHAQRENGGFGCDNCVGSGTLFLTVQGDGRDASWCCTMRGGEGLAEVAKSVALEKDGVLYIALYNPAEIRLPGCTIELRTTYPADGHVELLLKGRPKAGKIALFLPSYARDAVVNTDGTRQVMTPQQGFISVDVAENSRVTLDFTIPVQKLACNGVLASEGCYKLSYGFALLGVPGHQETHPDINRLVSLGNGGYQAGAVQLYPVGDTYKVPMSELREHSWQLVFRK